MVNCIRQKQQQVEASLSLQSGLHIHYSCRANGYYLRWLVPNTRVQLVIFSGPRVAHSIVLIHSSLFLSLFLSLVHPILRVHSLLFRSRLCTLLCLCLCSSISCGDCPYSHNSLLFFPSQVAIFFFFCSLATLNAKFMYFQQFGASLYQGNYCSSRHC